MTNLLHPYRFLSAFLFAILFLLTATLVNYLYFKYLDTTVYYSVAQPVSVDKPVYKPCEDTILTTKRTSLIDTTADFYRDLRLVRSDGAQFKVSSSESQTKGIIKSGVQLVSIGIKLPCDLPDGQYFWNVLISYPYKGNMKNYNYITQTFRVYKAGISPSAQDAIDKSATESAR